MSADVLFVTKPLAPPWDDSGKVLPYLLAKHLGTPRVAVMTPRGAGVGLPGVDREEIYPSGSSFRVPAGDKARLLARLLGRPTPPIVHFFFSPNAPTTAAARLFRRLHPRVRVVQTIMSLPRDPAALDGAIFAERVVCWSRHGAALAADVVARRGLSAQVVHVPPGIEIGPVPDAAARRAARKRLGLPADRPVVLYAGDLEFSTAARVTAGAASGILDRTEAVVLFACRPKTEAARVVDQDLRTALAGRAAEGRVRFLGSVPSFADLLAATDLQVLPAETTYAKTDLPLVLLEGLAAGVPAIVGTGTPMDELVEAGAARGVVPRDPAALTDAVVGLLSAPGALASLAAAGGDYVRARHSAKAMADAHRALYLELLHHA